ncbi:MAG: hypothetical protein J6W69_07660, partial [Bacteroidales bacterium]|nr:hypothetical protein [Bacteroidales bacterium]
MICYSGVSGVQTMCTSSPSGGAMLPASLIPHHLSARFFETWRVFTQSRILSFGVIRYSGVARAYRRCVHRLHLGSDASSVA